MGVPRLHIKKELNYRRGSATRHCSDCDHFMAAPVPLIGSRDPNAARCRIIGLHTGRAYRVLEGNICDRFDNSKLLARLKAGKKF